jgi:hypothetical protein
MERDVCGETYLWKSWRKIHWVQRTYSQSVVASSRDQSYEKPRLLS